MPCVSLKNNHDYKARLKAAASLAIAQKSEQVSAEKPLEATKIAKTSKMKAFVDIKAFAGRQKAKLATKRITRQAARAEQKATKASVKVAQKSQKLAAETLKIPHTRATGAAKMATGPAKAEEVATKAAAKPAVKLTKLKPQANLPGIISTKTAHQAKERPLPSSVFAKRTKTKPTRADLINAESRLGSQLFGQIPAGHRREFFHDKKNIWIWHEDWVDENEHERQMTIRYEVRTSGVYKKVAAGKYFRLEGAELENFRKATHAYLYVIKKYLYSHPYSKVTA